MSLYHSNEKLIRVEGLDLARACAAAATASAYLSTRNRAMHFDLGVMECYVDNPADPQCGVFVERYSGLLNPWSHLDMLRPLRAWLYSGQVCRDFEIACVALSEQQEVADLVRSAGFAVAIMPHDEVERSAELLVAETSWKNDFTISRLNLCDAELVNSLWPYRSEHSLELIRYLIAHRANFVVRRIDDQKSVGWILSQSDHSMGMSYVLPEYRSLGIMPKLLALLDDELTHCGLKIFGYVRRDNVSMLRSVEKVGWRFKQSSVWFHAVHSGSSVHDGFLGTVTTS